MKKISNRTRIKRAEIIEVHKLQNDKNYIEKIYGEDIEAYRVYITNLLFYDEQLYQLFKPEYKGKRKRK